MEVLGVDGNLDPVLLPDPVGWSFRAAHGCDECHQGEDQPSAALLGLQRLGIVFGDLLFAIRAC